MTLPERPLALLPRWAAALVLFLTLLACGWNAFALDTRNTAHETDIEQRLDRGEKLDMDLYRQVHTAVAQGENYYVVALQGNREFDFPTKPFVTVRTPVMAWGAALWGDLGWRIIAVILWVANALAWLFVLGGHVARRERDAAVTLSMLSGAAVFIPEVAVSHELQAGLLISLALALSATRLWIAALVAAMLGIAIRELAAPFLLAWAAVALVAGRRREFVGVLVASMLVALGLWLHAQGVAEQRLPDDMISPGWKGLFGPSLPLYGIHVTTLLQVLPLWVAGPLGVLPLLGWTALGGRTGALATLWFAGFIAAVAIFARQENFYWMGLFVPAYGVGLAFVPRALADLAASLRRAPSASPTPSSPR